MFRFLTAGESHGPALTTIIEGVPAGLPITAESINTQLKRRQGGYGRGARQKIESDTAEILSGIRFGRALGSPITLVVRNRDWANWTTKMSIEPLAEGEEETKTITVPRPGHADYAGMMKYGTDDLRNILERSSARNTATQVAVGAVARLLLAQFGISVASHVVSIGGVKVSAENIDLRCVGELAEDSPVRVADKDAEAQIIAAIDAAKYRGDTLGGVFEVVALGLPVGLGSHVHWDTKDRRQAGPSFDVHSGHQRRGKSASASASPTSPAPRCMMRSTTTLPKTAAMRPGSGAGPTTPAARKAA